MGLFEFLTICLVIFMSIMVYSFVTKKVERRDKTDYGDDETRTIQEIHRGLQRMEDRIESLETILMDHPRARSQRAHTDSD